MSDHELFAVGTIAKPFGVRGECVVHCMTPDTRRFKKLRRLYVGPAANAVAEHAVEYVRIESRGVRLKLADVDDRTALESLIGQILFVDEEQRIRPPRGTWFVHDIVGAAVIDEQRGPIGAIAEILKLPAHDVYIVRGAGQEIMIPAVKEFIRKVDTTAHTVTVRLIDGMMEP